MDCVKMKLRRSRRALTDLLHDGRGLQPPVEKFEKISEVFEDPISLPRLVYLNRVK